MAKGTHAFKFGGRLRGVSITDINPNNFGGTFTFTGALVPTLDANNQPITNQPIFVDSLERYRRTLLGQQLGLTRSCRFAPSAATRRNSASRPANPQSQCFANRLWRLCSGRLARAAKLHLELRLALRGTNQHRQHSQLCAAPGVRLVARSSEQHQASEDGHSRRRRCFLQSLWRRQHASSQSLQWRESATVLAS